MGSLAVGKGWGLASAAMWHQFVCLPTWLHSCTCESVIAMLHDAGEDTRVIFSLPLDDQVQPISAEQLRRAVACALTVTAYALQSSSPGRCCFCQAAHIDALLLAGVMHHIWPATPWTSPVGRWESLLC